jgi:hypothetical protein
VAGEANAYSIRSTFIPSTDEQLDRWLTSALTVLRLGAGRTFDGPVVVDAVAAVPRLVQEVVLSRSLRREDIALPGLHRKAIEENQQLRKRITALEEERDEALRACDTAIREAERRLADEPCVVMEHAKLQADLAASRDANALLRQTREQLSLRVGELEAKTSITLEGAGIACGVLAK